MTRLAIVIGFVAALVASACSSSSETCDVEAPINCSVARGSYAECSAPALCAGVCGTGTCCYCEDGDWKRVEVLCNSCDAGVVVDAAPAVDAGTSD